MPRASVVCRRGGRGAEGPKGCLRRPPKGPPRGIRLRGSKTVFRNISTKDEGSTFKIDQPRRPRKRKNLRAAAAGTLFLGGRRPAVHRARGLRTLCSPSAFDSMPELTSDEVTETAVRRMETSYKPKLMLRCKIVLVGRCPLSKRRGPPRPGGRDKPRPQPRPR